MATRILFACGLEKNIRGRCSHVPESETFRANRYLGTDNVGEAAPPV